MSLFLRVLVCACCPVLRGKQRRGGVWGGRRTGTGSCGTARLLRRGRASDLQASACPVNWSCSPLITTGPSCPARSTGSSHRDNFGLWWWSSEGLEPPASPPGMGSMGTSEVRCCCAASPEQLDVPQRAKKKKKSHFSN